MDQAAPPPVQSGASGGLPSGFQLDEEKYGSTGQQLLTGLEGAANSATFGIASGLERAAGEQFKIPGLTAEDQRARKETNPASYGTGQVVGVAIPSLIPGVGELPLAGEIMGTAGKAGSAALGLGGEGASLASQIGAHAAKGVIETAMFQGGDEVSKMMTSDPDQSVGTAIANVGLAGVLGGVTGGVLGSVSPIWNATVGEKAGKFIDDIKSRAKFHMENPNPAALLSDELQTRYSNIKDMADEVYGAKGLKAQEIQKLMPEMHEGISKQVQGINETLEKTINDLGDDPNSRMLQKEALKWQGVVTNPEATPGDIFDATQNLKQQTQEWGRFNKNIPPPLADRPLVNAAKELSYDLRSKLEDSDVWGKAAERQNSINSAFSEYLPALKDFEKKFTSAIGDEKVIDPGKIQTYLNQLGKPNAELKQSMLENFLSATDKYEKVVADTHKNLGIESPMQTSSLSMARSTLGETSPGANLVDAMVRKGLANAGGKTLGAAVGAGLGHFVGMPGIGALVGEHALGDMFSSILPSIFKPLLEAATNPEALKSASDYAVAVAKGNAILNKSAKAIFKASGEVVPTKLIPDEKSRNKLDKRLISLQQDPSQLLNNATPLDHYLPGHGSSVAKTAMNAVNFLNSQRPVATKQSPLDSEPAIPKSQKMQFERALDIAQQPMLIMDDIKNGTISSHDMQVLQTVNPGFYKNAVAKLTDQLIKRDHESEPIPYKTRQGLSMFLGQPLDSTFKQTSIASAQMANQSSNTQQQAQEAQGPAAPKSSSQGGLQKLAKYGQSLATSSQARQSKAMNQV